MSDVFARLDPDARQLLSPSAQPDWVAPMLAKLKAIDAVVKG